MGAAFEVKAWQRFATIGGKAWQWVATISEK
jgi:hypothetical protein